MKKLTALSLCVCLLAGILSGCAYPPEAPPDGTIRIVTTIFPIYDWTRNILGSREDVELTLLLDNRVDLHSFQPTAEDLVKIAECDLFICVGGESDDWVDDALRDAGKKGRNVIRLMDEISYALKEEEKATVGTTGPCLPPTPVIGTASCSTPAWIAARRSWKPSPRLRTLPVILRLSVSRW